MLKWSSTTIELALATSMYMNGWDGHCECVFVSWSIHSFVRSFIHSLVWSFVRILFPCWPISNLIYSSINLTNVAVSFAFVPIRIECQPMRTHLCTTAWCVCIHRRTSGQTLEVLNRRWQSPVLPQCINSVVVVVVVVVDVTQLFALHTHKQKRSNPPGHPARNFRAV